jgi:hypothetical protein
MKGVSMSVWTLRLIIAAASALSGISTIGTMRAQEPAGINSSSTIANCSCQLPTTNKPCDEKKPWCLRRRCGNRDTFNDSVEVAHLTTIVPFQIPLENVNASSQRKERIEIDEYECLEAAMRLKLALAKNKAKQELRKTIIELERQSYERAQRALEVAIQESVPVVSKLEGTIHDQTDSVDSRIQRIQEAIKIMDQRLINLEKLAVYNSDQMKKR